MSMVKSVKKLCFDFLCNSSHLTNEVFCFFVSFRVSKSKFFLLTRTNAQKFQLKFKKFHAHLKTCNGFIINYIAQF